MNFDVSPKDLYLKEVVQALNSGHKSLKMLGEWSMNANSEGLQLMGRTLSNHYLEIQITNNRTISLTIKNNTKKNKSKIFLKNAYRAIGETSEIIKLIHETACVLFLEQGAAIGQLQRIWNDKIQLVK